MYHSTSDDSVQMYLKFLSKKKSFQISTNFYSCFSNLSGGIVLLINSMVLEYLHLLMFLICSCFNTYMYILNGPQSTKINSTALLDAPCIFFFFSLSFSFIFYFLSLSLFSSLLFSSLSLSYLEQRGEWWRSQRRS